MLAVEDVHKLIRKACAKSGSQAEWARHIGVSRQFVNDVLKGHRAPTPAMLKALGLVRIVGYEKT